MKRLPRRFYARDPREVAPDLLNKILVAGDRRGRIVETEAYCGEIDPGAHSYRGRTKRTEVMFGPPGHLYVYLSYGMHWCCNPTCGPEGEGWAVLLRALAPLDGIGAMRAARPAAPRTVDLTNGPGKLTQALGITGDHNGVDLVAGERGITIVDDGTPPPDEPVVSTRIGLGDETAAAFDWRYLIPGDPHVSRPAGWVAARRRRNS